MAKVPNPIFYEDLLYYLTPPFFFPNFPQCPHPPALFCCFFALAEYVDQNFSSLGIVIPAAPCCVLYATGHQIYDRDDMVFASALTWNHTRKHTEHKWTNLLMHWANIYWHHLLQKYATQWSTMSLPFKYFSLVEVICLLWLDSTRLSPFSETQRILREMVQLSKTHTTLRETNNFRKR